MRIRSLRPEFWDDPDTTGVWPLDQKIVYVGLWSLADDEGRIEWNPKRARAALFPYYPEGATLTAGGEPIDFNAAVERIVAAGCLVIYEADGRTYASIPSFRKHQKPNRPTESVIPPAPLSERSRVTHAGEESRGEERRVDSSAEPNSAPPSPVVAALPCVGKGPTGYGITEAQVSDWRRAYPGVDVEAELLKARVWLDANPSRRKTHRGIPRFLLSWLNRAQNTSRKPSTPKDDHDATYRRLLDEAERELAEPRRGGGGDGLKAPAGEAHADSSPEARAAVSAAIGELLGDWGSSGELQDGPGLEHGPQRG